MAQDLINNDLHVNGTLSSKSLNPPAGSIGDAAVKAPAGIAATKLEHQFDLGLAQPPGSDVVAETRDLRVVHGGTGEVVAVKAALTGAVATGADRTVSIDLQKGNVAAGFVSILTAPVSFTNTDVLRAVKQATVTNPDVVVGDILRLVVTVAGVAGNQAKGLVVSVTLREDAQ